MVLLMAGVPEPTRLTPPAGAAVLPRPEESGALVAALAGFGGGDGEVGVELDGGVCAVSLGDVGFVHGGAVALGFHAVNGGTGIGAQNRLLDLRSGVSGQFGF